MEEDIRSADAGAAERFTASIGSSLFASSSTSPPGCDIEKVQQDIRRLIRMSLWIRATLADAENREITDESARRWLRELEGVADDAEDLLDEFPCEAMRLGLMGDGRWTPGSITEDAIDAVVQAAERTGWTRPLQVCSPGSPTPPHEIFAFLCHVEEKIEKIVSRFWKIKKPTPALQREYGKGERRVETLSTRRATSSMTQEPCIFGRNGDLETVKKFLLSSGAESSGSDTNVPVMAIVGMGGLGKTTLAQLAYNDDEVDKHFKVKSWVCVSEGFDLVRLTEAMLQSLNLGGSGISTLDPLQQKLLRRLDGQRSLLVLDDVWELENLSSSWGLLTAPLRMASAGSKIVITTRNKKVSEMGGRISTYVLPSLQYKDCLKLLFNQLVFDGRDPNLCQNLVAIGEKVARKCRGLPLVAKTLGGLLQVTDDEEVWNDILESEAWSISSQGNYIMPILRLSYQHLPAHLKKCFSYCSVFPKGHYFNRDQLIRMWMAHGYIKANRRELMEDVGKRYFEDLLSRSFFQTSVSSHVFLMHDLMHDLARCVTGDECCCVEDDKLYLIPRHVRHFSIVNPCDPIRSTMSTEDIPESRSIRSFLLIRSTSRSFNNIRLISDLLTRMEHLRVLDLNAALFSEFPESISRLKWLRYLALQTNINVNKVRLGLLPESLGCLCHLQTLHFGTMSDAVFRANQLPDRLPNCISNLINLRHFIYKGNYVPVEYPVGIGKLTDLQMMPGFRLSPEHDRAKLGELKDVNDIRGDFAITEINNLTDVNEVKKACLDKKRSIWSLHLKWNPNADPSPIDDIVLEAFRPSPKLGDLCISGFKGQSHPSWLGDRSFSRLSTVKLDSCQNWTFFPQLGQLLSLKSLYISSAVRVQYIDHEFFSGGFPQLETLILGDMDNLKAWCGAQKGECPRLRFLCVKSCRHLESLSIINLDAVKTLFINWCPQLQFSVGSLQLSRLPSLHEFHLEGIYGVGNIIGNLSDLSSPVIVPSSKMPCLELKRVDQREAGYVLGECSNIHRLTITRCSEWTSFPLGNLNALTYVRIDECPNLRFSYDSLQLRQLPSLEEIYVQRRRGDEYVHGRFSRGSMGTLETLSLIMNGVDQLEVLAVLDLCSHIRQLTISLCELTSLPLGDLHALEYLKISDCPDFQFLNVEQLSPTLRVLCIEGNPYATQWCTQHQCQRLKHVLQSENQGEDNLYFVFHNVLDAWEAADFCSWKPDYVCVLELEWDCCTNIRSNADAIAEELLEKLCPNDLWYASSLHKLVIRGYTGSRFASWLGNPCLIGLTSIALLQCTQCEILPLLSQLRCLVELYVEGASRLEHVGSELFDSSGNISSAQRCSFPSLKVLQFHDMPAWEEWQGTKEGDFPSLCKLILKHCPSLRALPHLPPTLQELELEACEQLVSLIPSDSSVQGLQALDSLRCLSLRSCPKLSFAASERLPSTLQYVTLTDCPLLLTWCDGHLSMLEHISEIHIDGFRVCTGDGKSISSQIEDVGMDGRVFHAS